jgi:hypothetical protein
MTPEMQFKCLLVCNDSAVYSTINRVLRTFPIVVEHYLFADKNVKALGDQNQDLIVIDCQGDAYAVLLEKLTKLTNKPRPTVVLIGEQQLHAGGSHIFLRRPVTDWSATEAVKTAYGRMLLNHRVHARYAVYERVEALDESGNVYPVVVTDIGEGGFGLRGSGISVGMKLSLRLRPEALSMPLHIQGRVIWTREYGVAGCEMLTMAPVDCELLRDWVKGRVRIRKPLGSA